MKKLLSILLILATLAALFVGCGVSKTPESETGRPNATTKATTNSDEADVNPGMVSSAATTESHIGKTLKAPEVLVHYADYDAFTITARITETVPDVSEISHLIGIFAYRKDADGSETYYYSLKEDREGWEGQAVIVEYFGCKDDSGEQVWIRLGNDVEMYPVSKTDDPMMFDGIEDFRCTFALYGIDYPDSMAGNTFVKGEDTMVGDRPCYTYQANLRRIVGQPFDYAVEIAVDKATGLWLKMEGNYTLAGQDGEGYMLEEIIVFEENADIIPEF